MEHHPVYTVGTGGGLENLLCSEKFLKEQGVEVVKVSRGGDITFHGPGQVIAYPVFDLTKLKRDVHWYVDSIEQVVINVLKGYGIEGSRKPKYRGVWVKDEKISAVGISLKKWITSHGLSFNINVDKKWFGQINPCGITEFGITSLEDFKGNVNLADVKEKLVKSFEDVFDVQFEV